MSGRIKCMNPACDQMCEADWNVCPKCETPLQRELKCACGTLLERDWRICPRCKTPTGFATSSLSLPFGAGCKSRTPGDEDFDDQIEKTKESLESINIKGIIEEEEAEEDGNGVSRPDVGCYLNDDGVWEQEVNVEGVALRMIYFPGGEFMMGAAEGDDYAVDEEKPRHRVVLSKGFWLGKYPVTQGQWKEVMGSNPSEFQHGDDHPVENVSWDDCQEFIKKLNRMTGESYRLPTEAEWEYACRAGTEGKWCFGDDEDDLEDYAWYNENSGGEPHPVGEKDPNEWGLYDMHGNVCEWCQDYFDMEYYKKSPSCDPKGPASGRGRVYRGGSHFYNARSCRASFRHRLTPDSRFSFLGFRLARGESSD